MDDVGIAEIRVEPGVERAIRQQPGETAPRSPVDTRKKAGDHKPSIRKNQDFSDRAFLVKRRGEGAVKAAVRQKAQQRLGGRSADGGRNIDAALIVNGKA